MEKVLAIIVFVIVALTVLAEDKVYRMKDLIIDNETETLKTKDGDLNSVVNRFSTK